MPPLIHWLQERQVSSDINGNVQMLFQHLQLFKKKTLKTGFCFSDNSSWHKRNEHYHSARLGQKLEWGRGGRTASDLGRRRDSATATGLNQKQRHIRADFTQASSAGRGKGLETVSHQVQEPEVPLPFSAERKSRYRRSSPCHEILRTAGCPFVQAS